MTDMDVAHLMTRDGTCKISINGQGHLPCDKHVQIVATRLASIAELREFLEAVGTLGPSLHPLAAKETPSRERWNGWNYTVTVGTDAEGLPFQAELWHFASGHSDLSLGHVPGTVHGAVRDYEEARVGVVFPVEVLPARSIVQHPEHTP